jgi:hypothetical protein
MYTISMFHKYLKYKAKYLEMKRSLESQSTDVDNKRQKLEVHVEYVNNKLKIVADIISKHENKELGRVEPEINDWVVAKDCGVLEQDVKVLFSIKQGKPLSEEESESCRKILDYLNQNGGTFPFSNSDYEQEFKDFVTNQQTASFKNKGNHGDVLSYKNNVFKNIKNMYLPKTLFQLNDKINESELVMSLKEALLTQYFGYKNEDYLAHSLAFFSNPENTVMIMKECYQDLFEFKDKSYDLNDETAQRKEYKKFADDMVDVARAIGKLHSKYNIAHLDIKPENMMRCPNELTKTTEKTNLIDFGAVKYSKGESSMTAGTLQYLPLSKNNYYYYPDDLFQVDWQAFRLTILALFDAYSTTEKERLTASFYINGNPFKEGLSTIAKGLTVDGKNK